MAEAAPAMLEKIVEDSLKCSICLETLSTPRALPCLHTFCEECIQSVISASKKTSRHLKFSCPDCRQETKLAVDRDMPVERLAEKLPLNFTVKNIIEGINDATNQIEASTADANATAGAEGGVHFNNIELCNIHTTEKLEFYCNKHKDVLCRRCKQKHWFCKTTKVEAKVAKWKESGTEPLAIFEEMTAIQDDLDGSINTLLKNVQEITVQVDGLPDSIKSLERELRTVIHKICSDVEENTEEIKETATKTQKATIAESMNWLVVLETLRADLELVHKHGTDVQMFIAAYQLQKQLNQLWDASMKVKDALQCVSLRLGLVDVLKGVLAVSKDLLAKVETRTYKPPK